MEYYKQLKHWGGLAAVLEDRARTSPSHTPMSTLTQLSLGGSSQLDSWQPNFTAFACRVALTDIHVVSSLHNFTCTHA